MVAEARLVAWVVEKHEPMMEMGCGDWGDVWVGWGGGVGVGGAVAWRRWKTRGMIKQ